MPPVGFERSNPGRLKQKLHAKAATLYKHLKYTEVPVSTLECAMRTVPRETKRHPVFTAVSHIPVSFRLSLLVLVKNPMEKRRGRKKRGVKSPSVHDIVNNAFISWLFWVIFSKYIPKIFLQQNADGFRYLEA